MANKPFEFRMSKKVAELTQVVHMLFTRNHEREVELEALRDAYEVEIDSVIADAKARIANLRGQIMDLEKSKALKASLEKMLKQKEEEWERRLETKDKSLQHEKKECQKLSDMLITAQRDIERLRMGVDAQLTNQTDELTTRDREIDRLKKLIVSYEKKLKENDHKNDDVINELKLMNGNLTMEIGQLEEMYEGMSQVKEQLHHRNKQLESDMRNLKKELTKRFNEMANQQRVQQFEPRSNKQTSYMEYNDEMEKLRREVQRYRMELSNREGNFNRMFTDKSPVVVDNRAGRIGAQQQQLIHGGVAMNVAPSGGNPFKREKTVSYSLTQTYDATYDESPVRSSSSMSRLPPMLSMETKNRLSRMAKPRPLPKEILSSK